MNQRLIDLYHRHIGMAFDRQLRFADFLDREAGGENWNYTISTATLSFGRKVEFQALDLGSHAFPDNSWLWAWGNPHLKLTRVNRALADEVRTLAANTEVDAFAATAQLSCEELLGEDVSQESSHAFAAIVARELCFDAYYTIPFESGRGVAVIRDDRLKAVESLPLTRVLCVFPQAINAIPIPDQKATLIHYLEAYDVRPAIERQAIHAQHGCEELVATFDGHNRLTEIKGTANKKD